MADEKLCERLSKSHLTAGDICQVEQFCYGLVTASELSKLQNDAKLRAVNSTKTYDEFKDIVDAAHLQPLTRADKQNAKTQSRLWNSIAKKVSTWNRLYLLDNRTNFVKCSKKKE